MHDTVFLIPEQIAGIPLFGAGLLLAVWALASVLLLAWLLWRQGFDADTRSYIPILLLIGFLIWIVLPKISEPGKGLAIRSYGVMMLTGIVSGTALAMWRAKRVGLNPDLILTLAFWGFVPAIVGARLFYVIEYWPQFRQETLGATLGEVINITKGGLVVYGSLVGGMLGLAACLYKEKLPALATLDVVAPALLLGLALGRVGCFLNGCCFGGECHLPWAVEFPTGSPPFVRQVEQGKVFLYGLKIVGEPDSPAAIAEVEPGSPAERQGLKAGQHVRRIDGYRVDSVAGAQRLLIAAQAWQPSGDSVSIQTVESRSIAHLPTAAPPPRSLPVHPTQLYSTIDALILCLFLLAYDPFRRRDGELLALLLTLYPISRFLMEFIRTDEPGILGSGLSIGQIVSLLILAATAGLWFYVLRKPPARALPVQAATA